MDKIPHFSIFYWFLFGSEGILDDHFFQHLPRSRDPTSTIYATQKHLTFL